MSTSSRRRPTAVGRSRRRPPARCRPVDRRAARHRPRSGPLPRLLIAAAALAALIALVVVTGTLGGDPTGVVTTHPATTEITRHLVYTAPTGNDARITLPAEVRQDLREVGVAQQQIALTRVEGDGATSTTVIDLTPRAGDSSEDPVLKVPERAEAEVDRLITNRIEEVVNNEAARSGGRALYAGLTRTDFSAVPVTIISSGLDLADPTDFRRLGWSVPAKQVASTVEKSGSSAALRGPVTFVVVPTAGEQPQLADAQKRYRNRVWSTLLTASGATGVTFVDAHGGPAVAATRAPVVAVPAGPGTPHDPPEKRPQSRPATCTVSSSYFRPDTAMLIDHERTVHDLRSCIGRAEEVDATYRLDGWTSYDGQLDARGRPATDDQGNRALSRRRVQTIADLLVHDLQVSRSDITDLVGHGNTDQPDPDPRSRANRVVLITYTAARR